MSAREAKGLPNQRGMQAAMAHTGDREMKPQGRLLTIAAFAQGSGEVCFMAPGAEAWLCDLSRTPMPEMNIAVRGAGGTETENTRTRQLLAGSPVQPFCAQSLGESAAAPRGHCQGWGTTTTQHPGLRMCSLQRRLLIADPLCGIRMSLRVPIEMAL